MRLLARLVWVLALWVFPIGGCNDVHIPPAPLELVITTWGDVSYAMGPPERLEGVEVCVSDPDRCDFSDANGEVTFEVPVDQEIIYTLAKEGYDSLLFAHEVPESGVSAIRQLGTHAQMKPLFECVMSPYPRRGTGSIQVFTGPPVEGATFSLIDATGITWYSLADFSCWVLDLTATTSAGDGGFVDVTPGTYQLQFGGTAERCVASADSLPGDVENSIRVHVRADHHTVAGLICPSSL
jgi:hypothetical protein